ncbi:unnamed protein product, partial [Phaeothamnion confervicola]
QELQRDSALFRQEWERDGPLSNSPENGVEGASPLERGSMSAVPGTATAARFGERLLALEARVAWCAEGQETFAVPRTPFPEVARTRNEVLLLQRIEQLHAEAREAAADYGRLPWGMVRAHLGGMEESAARLAAAAAKLPPRVHEWQAFRKLRTFVMEFSDSLPLLRALSRPAIGERHWRQLAAVTGGDYSSAAAAVAAATPAAAESKGIDAPVNEPQDVADATERGGGTGSGNTGSDTVIATAVDLRKAGAPVNPSTAALTTAAVSSGAAVAGVAATAFTAGHVTAAPLLPHAAAVHSICAAAEREAAIEARLEALTERWQRTPIELRLPTVAASAAAETERSYSSTDEERSGTAASALSSGSGGDGTTVASRTVQTAPAGPKTDEAVPQQLRADLEDAQIQLRAMLRLADAGPFRDRVEKLLRDLTESGEAIESWSCIFRLWADLGSVFAALVPARQSTPALLQRTTSKDDAPSDDAEPPEMPAPAASRNVADAKDGELSVERDESARPPSLQEVEEAAAAAAGMSAALQRFATTEQRC